ncbi:MAG: CARDB domain-containing protein [Myxococcota bacterium]
MKDEMRDILDRASSRLMIAALAVLLMLATGCAGCDDTGGGGNNGGDAGGDVSDTGGADASDASDSESDDTGSDDAGDTADAFCSNGTACGSECCTGTDECVEGQCLPPCGGERCGADLGLCCEGGDLCIGQQCVAPGEDCERTEQCEIDEICEPTLGKCLPRDSVEVCEYRPPVGQFSPERDCRWTPNPGDPRQRRDAVEAAPVVINVTDDNGDGLTNSDDIPDIIFPAHNYRDQGCCSNPSTIRIVSGECNADGTMTTLGSISEPATESSQGLAAGDLNGDGIPEIVGIKQEAGNAQGTVAWTRDSDDGSQWSVLWENDTYPTFDVHTRGGAIVSLADLDADGNPEVIIGNVVLNGQDGTLKWDGVQTSGGTGGIGNNAFLGPSSSVGDIDNDGKQEVLAGNTLYDHDGVVLWTYTYPSSASYCQGQLPCDGFSAMANFDDDPFGEAVIVREGEVFILEHTGQLKWKREIFWDDCTKTNQNLKANEAGPPTIADFDGDGEPEIGTAGADFYVVMDMECDPSDPDADIPDKCEARGVLWAASNEDCTSRATASSVFDFEGDGKAEMVYADEQTFKIHDGTDGTVLYSDSDHGSNTRIEMPIVVDVDNDGNSEAVVPAPYTPNRGISVWGDADDNWVRTRRIWNQHAYSVTNITEDGEIPRVPEPNWQNSRLNNFRQQIQPGGVFDAADLQVTDISLGAAACFASGDTNILVTVKNDGALGQPAGVPVEIYLEHNGSETLHDTVQTQTRLLPGQTETLASTWAIPDGWVADGFSIRAVVDPDNSINECEEGNNEQTGDSATLVGTLPDLIFESVSDVGSCGQSFEIEIEFTMRNDGSGTVPAGVPIVFETRAGGSTVEMGQVTTSAPLAAGETETLTFTWPTTNDVYGSEVDVTLSIDPNNTVFNCENIRTEEIVVDCRPEG